MKTRFRVNRNDTVKVQLVDKEGKLLTTLYDSGFTTIKQCYNVVLSKCCNPPKKTGFNIYNEDQDTYYSNY